MFLELFATLVMGFGVAGLVLLANKVLRGRLPRWMVPASAAISMLAFTIWSEYTWYPRTADSLPEPVIVAWSNQESAPWKPWTYAVPQVTRFVALDTRTIRTNAALPDQRMVDLYLMGRWAQGRQVRVLIDCAGARRADLVENVTMDDRGAVDPSVWVKMDPSDPVLTTACNAEVG